MTARSRRPSTCYVVITLDDGGPADVEHVLLAAAYARGGLTVGDVNKVSARLVRPAKFALRHARGCPDAPQSRVRAAMH